MSHLCTMTGRWRLPSSATYSRLKRMGNWKSSCTVAHWYLRRSASNTVMSILGPAADVRAGKMHGGSQTKDESRL